MDKKRTAVLGSSGSIGAKAVMLIEHVNKVGSQLSEGHEAYQVVVLSVHKNIPAIII